MKWIWFVLAISWILSCAPSTSGTGTETPNALVRVRMVSAAKASAFYDNQYCVTDTGSLICYSQPMNEINYDGLVVEGTVTDVKGSPLPGIQIAINLCDEGPARSPDYLQKTNSFGQFSVGVQHHACVAVEVMHAIGDEVLGVAYVDSLTQGTNSVFKDIPMKLPIHIEGLVQLNSSVKAMIVGVSGTRRRMIVKDQERFSFPALPEDVEFFYLAEWDESLTLDDLESWNRRIREISLKPYKQILNDKNRKIFIEIKMQSD
jgi:hypothetical protein